MSPRKRVSAVSYLNTAPLVWGMAHGPQKGVFDLRFELPSECADALRAGAADVGLVPAIELARQPDLVVMPGCAIASPGRVRSILLVSKKPLEEIESFAADSGSRTSVVMTQVLLAKRYGLRPRVRPYPPKLDEMLELADAALIIGDAALRIDPAVSKWRDTPVQAYDMGAEWREITGLPMVFAVWAAKNLAAEPWMPAVLNESAAYGRRRIDEIVESESSRLGLDAGLVRAYLTENVSFDLGEEERRSMAYFLKAAAELGLVESLSEVPYFDAEAVAGEETAR